MERLIDPTLADLQSEYESAARGHRRWERVRVLVLGHVALVRVLAVHGGIRAMGYLRYSTPEDRLVLIRTVGASALIMTVGTLILMIPFVKDLLRNRPDSAELAFYLIPQALPLSIPVGVTFGILWSLRSVAASRRSRALILILAMMASVASFTMLGWVAPTANQAFRVTVSRHPLPKGIRELTLGELRRLLEHEPAEQTPFAASFDPRILALNYHGRWALAGAPLALASFALALTHRRQRGRLLTLLAGCLAILGYYVLMSSGRQLGRDNTLSAFAASWTPNVAFLVFSAAVLMRTSRRANVPARV